MLPWLANANPSDSGCSSTLFLFVGRHSNTTEPFVILLNLYLTCVRSHLEYNIFMLESVQKFACRVWELDCDSMPHLLGITRLSTRQQSLKLVTLIQSS